MYSGPQWGWCIIFHSIIGFHRQDIEFTNDFDHADITSGEPLLVEIYRYFNSDVEQHDDVLILKKRLYGQAKDAHIWYENLQIGLLDRVFVAIKVDHCLLMYKSVICVVYVDYFLFWEHCK